MNNIKLVEVSTEPQNPEWEPRRYRRAYLFMFINDPRSNYRIDAYDTSKCLDFPNKPQTQGFSWCHGSQFFGDYIRSKTRMFKGHGFPFYGPLTWCGMFGDLIGPISGPYRVDGSICFTCVSIWLIFWILLWFSSTPACYSATDSPFPSFSFILHQFLVDLFGAPRSRFDE